MTEKAMNHAITRKLTQPTGPDRFPSILVHLTPVSEGMTYDQWMFKQQLCTPREIEEYLNKRSAERKAKETAANPKPKSGALPRNTDWL